MTRAYLKCDDCGEEMRVELRSYDVAMARDFCELINGTSKMFMFPPEPGDPLYSSKCCGAFISYRVECSDK